MSLATDTKGAALHWNGPPMGLLSCDGSACERAWQRIRRYHVEDKGWRDIAYSFGVCLGCGKRLTGRDWGVRTAANGTNYGNDHYHAFMVLFGEGEPLTDVAKVGVLDLAAEHKRRYGRMRLIRHRDLKSTTCPGSEASRWVDDGAPDPRGSTDTDDMEDLMAKFGPPLQIVRDERDRWYLYFRWDEQYAYIASPAALNRLTDRAKKDDRYAETRTDWQSAWWEGAEQVEDRT